MGIVTWLPNANGNWNAASNWSGGALPTSADTAVISTSTFHTITHSKGNDVVGGLSVGNDLLSVTGGSLAVVGAAAFASGLTVSGGTLDIGASTPVIGPFTQSGGSVAVAGTLTVHGQAKLVGGGLGSNTILQVSSLVTFRGYTIGGGAQFQDSYLAYQAGTLTLGDSSGVGASIDIAAGAAYDFVNSAFLKEGATTAQLANAGTLAAFAGTGTSTIGVSVSSTGIVSVASGAEIDFQGPATTLAGTLAGAGEIGLTGGSATLAAGSSIGIATLALSGKGTGMTLGADTTLVGAFQQKSGSTIFLAGYTLTIDGNTSFAQAGGTPVVTGGGALVTHGSTSISGTGSALVIASSVAWNNFGNVIDYQGFQIGDSSAAATLVNEVGAVFDLVAATKITNGSNSVSSFMNAGVLEMTGFGNSSSINLPVTNTGTILAQVGALSFLGPVTGDGLLAVASGGTLAFSSTVQSTETMSFLDDTGELNLTLPSAMAFGAEISGFTSGDLIDLTNVNFSKTTESFSGGTLTFIDNSSQAVVATLQFSNTPTFMFMSDGHNGTLIGGQ